MTASLSEIVGNKFMYFAYGSNLLTKRMRVQLPSAERVDCGFIKDYRLDFCGKSETWQGAPATIVEDNNAIVWGAIWKIDLNELIELDRQERVAFNMYKPLLKIVETPTGEKIPCRVYQQCISPTIKIENNQERPIECAPSKTYLDTIISGAIESKLPQDYIQHLQQITNNGLSACKTIIDAINM